MQYQCQSPEASSAMSRVGSRLLAGRSGVLVFSWDVPGEWKFFRRTVDLSTLSPVLSEKLVYRRLFGMNEGWPVHRMSKPVCSSAVRLSFAGGGQPDLAIPLRAKEKIYADRYMADRYNST